MIAVCRIYDMARAVQSIVFPATIEMKSLDREFKCRIDLAKSLEITMKGMIFITYIIKNINLAYAAVKIITFHNMI